MSRVKLGETPYIFCSNRILQNSTLVLCKENSPPISSSISFRFTTVLFNWVGMDTTIPIKQFRQIFCLVRMTDLNEEIKEYKGHFSLIR